MIINEITFNLLILLALTLGIYAGWFFTYNYYRKLLNEMDDSNYFEEKNND